LILLVLLLSLLLSLSGLLKGVTSNKVDVEQGNDDDIHREAAESEMTWLLSGMGRWNIKMEAEVTNRMYEHANVIDPKKVTRTKEIYMPAAQISTTSPRINVDAASEANEIFSLNLTNKWHYKGNITSSSSSAAAAALALILLSSFFIIVDEGNPIMSMMINSIESLLVTSR